MKGRSVLVVGGGVGGLAAALAMRQHGAHVVLYEQSDEIREVGAGLQISPNGDAVLKALGVGDDVASAAVRAKAVVLRDYRRSGEVLRLDLRRRPNWRYLLVHRADLIDRLAQAARDAGVDIRLGRRVSSVSPGARPSVRLADGAEMSADLVIGADGVRSQLRAALNQNGAAFFTGQFAWRAIVDARGDMPPEASLTMAPGRHVVTYPLRRGRCMNLVGIQERAAWTEESWMHAGDVDAFRAVFSDFRGPARDVIDKVKDVAVWGLFRHPVARNWQRDGVVLLGDAAHPTLPFLAQGANLALEDAWTLAKCLSSGLSLRDYQDMRRPRAQKVIAAANRNAWKYHVRFGPARALGHLGLHLVGRMSPDRMLRQFDWLHGHDVTR